MAGRDRAKGVRREDIEFFSKVYGDCYDKDRMTIKVTFPSYGMGMKSPEEVIEEAVRQCIVAGAVEFRNGNDRLAL
jgi:hypothetical protein